ncbi:MAG: FAD-containing oxidoreductase [Alphaproteobacteria bacterium]|nr:FAD-containing oxidoreductase [Alphaproteobacteria bacterium]MBV8412077.1 FAD-containing oxidoreductase [Alphaproteobacteria bacterium]
MTTYDAIIIGTGQSGPSLARRLASSGRKVAIIERGLFGGTCVNTGCTPTKTMVASAHAVHLARRGADFGFSTGEIQVDMKRVKARKDYVAGLSNKGVERSLRQQENCTVIQGHARFRSAREVEVGGEVLSAERIFVNVGGRAAVPDIPGLDGIDYLTNSSMMDVDYLPRHLLVLGGSYIGLEFGQMFRRFGSEVTAVEVGPRLVPREDDDVSQAIAEFLGREGITIRTSVKCLSLSKRDGEIIMTLDCEQGPHEVRGSHLLLATGRRPNTDDLGLDRAGVKQDAKGFIEVDDELRTSVPGIWALGDCNGRGAFTHTSYNDFEIVAANLLDGDKRRVSDRIQAYALYTDPPLGRAGMSETEVRRSGRQALIAKIAMEDVSRAFEKGETDGFMKILVDAQSKQILGASFLGTSGDEAIHCVLDVMYAKAPFTVLQRAMHIHPTVAEFIPTMLEDLKPL